MNERMNERIPLRYDIVYQNYLYINLYLVQQYHCKLKYTRKHKINSYISYVTNEPDLLDRYTYKYIL